MCDDEEYRLGGEGVGARSKIFALCFLFMLQSIGNFLSLNSHIFGSEIILRRVFEWNLAIIIINITFKDIIAAYKPVM